jgi:hypothetical protein
MVAPGSRLDAGAPVRPGGSWFQRNKGIAIGGGIAVVTLVGYLFYRSRQNAAAAAASSAPATGAATSAPTAGSYDTTGYGYYPYSGGYGGTMDMSTLASTLASIESQIAAKSATSAAAPATNFNASGLTTGGTTGSGSGQFLQVPNVQANQQLYAAHIPQYEEVAPGDFIPDTQTYKYQGKIGVLPGGITPYTYIYQTPASQTTAAA